MQEVSLRPRPPGPQLCSRASVLPTPGPLLAPSPKASPATGSELPPPLRGPETLSTRVNSLFIKLASVYPLGCGSVAY